MAKSSITDARKVKKCQYQMKTSKVGKIYLDAGKFFMM